MRPASKEDAGWMDEESGRARAWQVNSMLSGRFRGTNHPLTATKVRAVKIHPRVYGGYAFSVILPLSKPTSCRFPSERSADFDYGKFIHSNVFARS